MNLKQITEFREIMRTGSVSQAARNLNRTQPAISASLRALEQSLDMPLFERHGKRLHPVPEAHYLYAEVDDIINRLQTTRQNMRNLRDLESGVLRIVAMPGPSAFLLPKLISQFTRDKPQVKVTLITQNSLQVHQMVATQAYDIGIADKMDADEVDISLMNVDTIDSECVCALPVTDPLTQKSTVTVSDLDSRPLGVLHTGHITYTNTRHAFEQAGAAFNPTFHTQYFLPLFEFVAAGQACAIVDKLSAASYRLIQSTDPHIAFRPFKPAVTTNMVCLQPGHRSQSKLAQEFARLWLAQAREICRKENAGEG